MDFAGKTRKKNSTLEGSIFKRSTNNKTQKQGGSIVYCFSLSWFYKPYPFLTPYQLFKTLAHTIFFKPKPSGHGQNGSPRCH